MDPHSPQTTGTRFDRRSALSRLGPAVLYLLGAAILWRHFDFIYYKDELSYLSAAARYARGDLSGVNAYWAPLLSWLLTPLLALGVPAATASDIVSVFSGLFALQGARALIRTTTGTGWLASLLDYTMVPIALYCAMLYLSPDLLLAGILAWYFSIVLHRDYPMRASAGYLSGVLGGLAYYAKMYAFYFFAAHFVLVNVGHYLWADPATRANVRRHFLRGMLVFAAMVAVWVGAMYAKYHIVTLGLTGKYNYAIVGPDVPDRPILRIGFSAEPRPGNTSAWEDPADFYRNAAARECCLKRWSPLATRQGMTHQLRLIKTNLAITLEQFQLFSSLSYAVIVVCVLLCIPRLSDARAHLPVLLALLALGLYPAGYLLVYSEERYLWPMLFLLVALSGYVLRVAFATSFFTDVRRRQLLAAFVALSFVKVPTSKLLQARDYGRNTSRIAEALSGVDLRGKRVASNADFGASDIVAYHHSAAYLGQKRPGISPEQTAAELKASRVEYYLVWGDPPADSLPPGLTRVASVKVEPGKGGQTTLTVFQVN
ncbi:MAG TPA: hypothetical protein VFS59_00760 [Gemmatimonadaceae bacterium]|nr:hypothetical protein [Gemmatimonadaceae bacterium]